MYQVHGRPLGVGSYPGLGLCAVAAATAAAATATAAAAALSIRGPAHALRGVSRCRRTAACDGTNAKQASPTRASLPRRIGPALPRPTLLPNEGRRQCDAKEHTANRAHTGRFRPVVQWHRRMLENWLDKRRMDLPDLPSCRGHPHHTRGGPRSTQYLADLAIPSREHPIRHAVVRWWLTSPRTHAIHPGNFVAAT